MWPFLLLSRFFFRVIKKQELERESESESEREREREREREIERERERARENEGKRETTLAGGQCGQCSSPVPLDAALYVQ